MKKHTKKKTIPKPEPRTVHSVAPPMFKFRFRDYAQVKLLDDLFKLTGTPKAELVRRALDRYAETFKN